MRAFIAIQLSDEIKSYLTSLQNQLKQTQADVKWVKPDNIHLTLKFLGEVDEDNTKKIIQILDDICKNHPSFLIRLSTIGAFPNLKYPRIIWAGIDTGDAQLKQLVHQLEENIQKIGIPKEKRDFSSHITLGRVRSHQNNSQLTKTISELANNFEVGIETKVNQITLFKSTLTSKGPIYEVIHASHLKNI